MSCRTLMEQARWAMAPTAVEGGRARALLSDPMVGAGEVGMGTAARLWWNRLMKQR